MISDQSDIGSLHIFGHLESLVVVENSQSLVRPLLLARGRKNETYPFPKPKQMNGPGASRLPSCLPRRDATQISRVSAEPVNVNVGVWFHLHVVQYPEGQQGRRGPEERSRGRDFLNFTMPKIELDVFATFCDRHLNVVMDSGKYNHSIRHRTVRVRAFQNSPGMEHCSLIVGILQR